MDEMLGISLKTQPVRLQNIAVPEDVHRALKTAAARRGIPLWRFVEPALRNLAMAEQHLAGEENRREHFPPLSTDLGSPWGTLD